MKSQHVAMVVVALAAVIAVFLVLGEGTSTFRSSQVEPDAATTRRQAKELEELRERTAPPLGRTPLEMLALQPRKDETLQTAEQGSPWAIVVHDEGGVGIIDASVLVLTSSGALPVGRTSNDGVFESRDELLAGARIEVRHAGYATETRTLAPLPEELRLTLHRAGRIHGRIVRHDGTSPGAGVRVLAVPASESWDPRFLRLSQATSPIRHLSLTNDRGEYEIADAREGGLYHLLVGGEGVVGGPAYDVQPGSQPVPQIAVVDVYGAVVELIDSEGQPVASPDEPHSLIYERARVTGSKAGQLGPSSPLVYLMGMGLESLHSRSRRLMLFVPREHGEVPAAIGPVYYETHFPGFANASVEFLAEPMRGSIPTYQLTHVPEGSGEFGAVEVNLAGLRDFGLRGERTSYIGVLYLTPVDSVSSSRRLEFTLKSLSDGKELVDGVPVGEYTVEFLMPNCSFVWPSASAAPELVSVEADGVVAIRVEASDLGAVLVDIRRADGSPYRGGFSATLGEGPPVMRPNGSVATSGGGNDVVFRRGPHLIQGLVPNTYTIKVRKPMGAMPDYRPIEFVVPPGELAVIPLVIRDDL